MKNKNHMIKMLVFVVLSTFFLIACEEKSDKSPIIRPVKAITVGEENKANRLSFPGRAKAAQEVNLAFKVAGLLVERPIIVGDLVKAGQIIAKLDSREFVSRLNSAQAEAVRDMENFRRAQTLIRGGNVSKADFELLKTKSTVSNTNVDLAQKTLADAVIKAPFAGRIARTFVKNHQTVAANQPIARLLDISQIEMVVQIPETIISVIPFAKDITVRFDAFPNIEIPATIKEISTEASAETRTFPLTLTMNQPKNLEILPGMAGNASGSIVYPDKEGHALLTLPETALFTPSPKKQTFVWIVDKNTQKVHQKAVSIGDIRPTGITITEGLESGDIVVIAGVHSLQEGDKVTLLKTQDE